MIRRLLDALVRLLFAFGAIAAALDLFRSPRARLGGPATAQARSPWTSFLRRWLFRAAVLGAIAGAVGLLVAVSGVVPIKASSGHWSITEAFLQFAKRRSVAAHSFRIAVPPLDDPRLVQMGAGHYDFACLPCHGSPSLEQPRIARQMLPRPPDLRKSAAEYDPEDLFYIVKHGIKLTGMPAWPALQRDDEVWAMIAFVRTLPQLDAREYEELARGPITEPQGVEPLEELAGPTDVPGAIRDSCSRCHGADGLGRNTGAFPRLSGQRPAYLLASLQAYAKGERHSGIMEPLAAALEYGEMEAIAQYYATLGDRPPASALQNTSEIERGRAIATAGLPEQLVPACVECHGPGGHRRNPTYPALAGQYAEYLALQLSLLKAGHRGGTPYQNIMQKVARQLTEDQMRAVASYYASLPWGAGVHTP